MEVKLAIKVESILFDRNRSSGHLISILYTEERCSYAKHYSWINFPASNVYPKHS